MFLKLEHFILSTAINMLLKGEALKAKEERKEKREMGGGNVFAGSGEQRRKGKVRRQRPDTLNIKGTWSKK